MKNLKLPNIFYTLVQISNINGNWSTVIRGTIETQKSSYNGMRKKILKNKDISTGDKNQDYPCCCIISYYVWIWNMDSEEQQEEEKSIN